MLCILNYVVLILNNNRQLVFLLVILVGKQDKVEFKYFKNKIVTCMFYNPSCFLLDDPEPYIDGVRINSPHYLCKIVVPQGGTTRYTLVISQYQKSHTIYYTLRAFSTVPFTLSNISNVFKYKHEVSVSQFLC